MAKKETSFHPRRIDVLSIAPEGASVVAYEIKVSLQDFRQELRDPSKRAAVIKNSSHFYFVVPIGLISAEDIPSECGLIYFFRGKFSVITRAPGAPCELPFESSLVDDLESSERERIRLIEEEDLEEPRGLCGNDWFDLPDFMQPNPPRRPIHFDFDVQVAASTMPSIQESFQCDFDEVPF